VYFSNYTKNTSNRVWIFILKTVQKNPINVSRKDWFFTRKPTKLVLHFSNFSTICNDFSKLQLKTLEQLYSRVPGILHREPWKESNRCNVVPGAGRPHRWPNPRPATAGLGRRAAPAAATDRARAGLGRPVAAPASRPRRRAATCSRAAGGPAFRAAIRGNGDGDRLLGV
jgi:hypothetical protein